MKEIEKLLEHWGCLNAYKRMLSYQEQMRNNNGMMGYSSHYPMLDKYTSWIIPWKVYTIAAYSNVGKSRFVYWYINHFLSIGKKVLFFNLEVDKWMCFLNICCNRYNLYSYEMKEDKIDILDYTDLYIFDDVYNLDDITSITEEIMPDVVIIDFVQNINVKWASWYESMAMIAKWLQQMAIKTNSTVFNLSQLSNTSARELNNGNTDFVPLKWAWEFTASSDIIFVLRMVDNQLWLTVVKTKYAQKPKDEIMFNTDFGKSKFVLDVKVLHPDPF